MNTSGPQSLSSVGAVHVQGDTARVLLAGLTGPGSPNSPRDRLPSGLRSMSIPAADTRAIAQALEAAGAQLVVRVFGSDATIVKTVPLPVVGDDRSEDSAEQVCDALALMAETELPANLPSYRRGVGAVRPAGDRFPEIPPVGMLTGWPVSTAEPRSSTQRIPWPCPEVWIGEVAALSCLAQALGGVEHAVYLDRQRSAGAIVVAGKDRTLHRVFRLPDAAAGPLDRALRRTLDESAKIAGVAPISMDRLDGVQQALVVSPQPQPGGVGGAGRVPVEASDRDWLAGFGIAYGALVAAVSADPCLRGLASLHEREPKAKPPVHERAIRWFSVPSRAVVAIVVCAIALLAVPLGIAHARYSDLKQRTGGQATVLARIAPVERQVAFYQVLRERRWPMTKLLADISGAAPVGIVLQSLEMNQGEGVTVRGTADNTELVTSFRENLNRTQIFSQVSTPSISASMEGGGGTGDKDSAGVQFQLTAKIPPRAAVVEAKPAEDFAERSLVERLYGRSDNRDHGSSPSSSSRHGRGSTSRSTPSDALPRAGPKGSSPGGNARTQAANVPAPLSDAQIARLDANKAMIEWSSRKQAANQAGIDDATRKRLLEESEKAKARMIEARQAGSGAGNSADKGEGR